MESRLSHSRRRTYDAIFRRPAARFGGGTGAGSAMEQLVAGLKLHHGEVAKRIVGSIVLDETHLTENQLLARAREPYAGIASHRTTHSPTAKTGPNR